MPKSKHWWHITLYESACGLTTTPFPIAGRNLGFTLDLAFNRLVIDCSTGWSSALPLAEQSAAELCRRISATLAANGIGLESELLADFDSEEILPYDTKAIGRFIQVIN